MRRLLLVALLLAAGCESEVGALVIQVRADLIVGTEVFDIRTQMLSDTGEVLETLVYEPLPDADLASGVRIAELADLEAGTYFALVSARDSGGLVTVERPLRVEVGEGIVVVTVLLTRDCIDVSCPIDGADPGAVACLGGRCVEDGCTEETPELCGTPRCTRPSECPSGETACVTTECTASGACFSQTIPDACSEFVDVEAGYGHACAVRTDGRVLCWGDNGDGELGDGSTTRSTMPVSVVGLMGPVVSIAAGSRFTCALYQGGDVACWGSSGRGRLGHGMQASQTSPQTVEGISDAVAIATWVDFTCALLASGEVWCWGANADAQLGIGAGDDQYEPVRFADVTDAVALDVGLGHTCVVHAGGALTCLGRGLQAQLGDGTETSRPDLAPVSGIPSTSEITQVSAGGRHTCARTSDGQLFCWGNNGSGQVGDGTNDRRFSAFEVLPDIAQVTAGDDHTCARTTAGEVSCWGDNDSAEIGDHTHIDRDVPIPLGITGAVDVTTGPAFSCALLGSGEILCWGDNTDGQLGNGRRSSELLPARADLVGVTQIAAGANHTCATTVAEVFCWGDNRYGQLGDGTTDSDSDAQLITSLGSMSEVAAGSRHTCARTDSGLLQCWGSGARGRLGDGSMMSSSIPVSVVGVTDSAEVALGGDHTCSRSSPVGLGTVYCWGQGIDGQLGDGLAMDSSTPVMTIPSGVDAVAAGWDATCVVYSGGSAACWGDNTAGALGDDSTVAQSNVPVDVGGLVGLDHIAVGLDHACAVDDMNQLHCWGHNGLGQLGDGTENDAPIPARIIDAGVDDVGAYGGGTCVLMTDRTVQCWGQNRDGEVGDGTRLQRNTPFEVPGVTNVVQLAVGEDHVCVLDGDGVVTCWGSDRFGQLGRAQRVFEPGRVGPIPP